MPHAIKLQEEFGDDVQVLFVESQGATGEVMEGFALDHKWMGNQAIWTTERPFDSGSRGLPSYVLIGADGRVVMKGNHADSKTTEAIEEEIENAGKPPADVPKDLAKAWKYFQKGDVAKALEAARKEGADPALAGPAEAAVEEFHRRTSARLDQVEWRIANGYLVAAEDLLDSMAKGLKGAGELEERHAGLEQRLDSDELKPEREASVALARVLDKLYEDGFDKKGKLKKKLEKVAKDHDGTKAAERARHIASLAT